LKQKSKRSWTIRKTTPAVQAEGDLSNLLQMHHAGQVIRDYLQLARTLSRVIPAKAGIQVFRGILDPGLRRGDGVSEF
jgi:hypothetical protein